MFCKKGRCLSFECLKSNFATVAAPLEKSFWLRQEKSTLVPPGKNPFDAHGRRYRIYVLRVS